MSAGMGSSRGLALEVLRVPALPRGRRLVRLCSVPISPPESGDSAAPVPGTRAPGCWCIGGRTLCTLGRTRLLHAWRRFTATRLPWVGAGGEHTGPRQVLQVTKAADGHLPERSESAVAPPSLG